MFTILDDKIKLYVTIFPFNIDIGIESTLIHIYVLMALNVLPARSLLVGRQVMA